MEHMLDKDVERVLFSEEELHRRVAEIAAEMEVSPQTVNYHIGQALKVLGVALKDYLPLIALFFEMPGNN